MLACLFITFDICLSEVILLLQLSLEEKRMIVEKTLRQFTKRADVGRGFVYLVRDQALFVLRLLAEGKKSSPCTRETGYQVSWPTKMLSGHDVYALARRFAEEHEGGCESNLPARFFSSYDLPDGHGRHPFADSFVWFPLEKERGRLDWYDLEAEAIHNKFLKEEGEYVTRCQYRLVRSFVNFPEFFVEAVGCNLKSGDGQVFDPQFVFTTDNTPFFRRAGADTEEVLNVEQSLRDAFFETSGIVSRAEANEVISAARKRIWEFFQKERSKKQRS